MLVSARNDVTDDASNLGETTVGLIEMCTSSSFSTLDKKCFIPRHIRTVWIISFCLAIGAIVLLMATVLLLLISQYARVSTVEYGRLTGFIARKTLATLPVITQLVTDVLS